MKKYISSIQTVLILALVIIVLLQRGCKRNVTPDPEVITKIETKWDTVKVVNTKYVPKWRIRTETIHDTIPADIDTLEILKDYYAKYFYSDTIQLDTLGSIVINDTVTRNLISMRDIESNILIPTTTITKEIYLNKREFYWGLGVQGRTDQLNYVGGEFMYKTKNKQQYGIGLGLNQDLQPVLSGRLYWKIGN
jgi:hypothetical protein